MADEEEGRSAQVTIKLTEREKRAAGVVAEVRRIGVSTLLHQHPIQDVVRIYDGIVDLARQAQ